MNIGEKIKQRRIELNMSQQKLADILGYRSRSSINKIELGKADITQTKLFEIARVLNVTPAHLMGCEDKGNDNPIKECSLNRKEIEHINTYRKLNTLGQDKADEYINDLTENPKYTANKSSHIKSFNLHEGYEIAAWGAEGTEGTFETPEEEIT